MNFHCSIAWGQGFLGAEMAWGHRRELFAPFHIEWKQRRVSAISFAGTSRSNRHSQDLARDCSIVWVFSCSGFAYLTFSRHLAVQSALDKEKMRDIRKEMQRNACHISQCVISHRNFDHLVKWKD